MELFSKVMFAVIFVLTMSSKSHSAPANSKPKRLQLLVKDIMAPRVSNATTEVGDINYKFLSLFALYSFKC